MEEKKGVITEIIFHNQENGYTIAELETENELLTVVGELPSAEVGGSFCLRGDMTSHPKYGEQFAFKEAEMIFPTTKSGIQAFLSSGIVKGVGQKTAAQLVQHFGEETLEIIGDHPERLTEVSGIGKKTAEKIADSYAQHRAFAEVSMFFQAFGISAAQCMQLYRAYGREAVRLIRENPYRLTEDVRGIGFRKADSIAMKMGIEADSPDRIESGIRYTLRVYADDGSTCVPREELLEHTAGLLDLTREEINDQLIRMAFAASVRIERICGTEMVYLYRYYELETRTAKNLAGIAAAEQKTLAADVEGSIRTVESRSGITLSPEQREAAVQSVSEGLTVITGGPGTGKTTIIHAILEVFRESGFRVALAAPTGRAAKRITETSHQPATTVHRLLEYASDDATGEMVFGRTAENPLKKDVVIVDEASMLDLPLMAALTSAIVPGTRLILVGDVDQLPSVGAGNVLRDIIESGIVKVARLTEIFRQAQESMIVMNAHRINQGEYPDVNGKGTDFFLMQRGNENEIRDLVVELATRRLGAYYHLDPLRDIQVLTPVHKGNVGTLVLNQALQEAFNPPRPGIPEKKYGDRLFRQGDKVMQIRNNYQIEWKRTGEEETHTGVYNGDMGYITSVNNEDGIVTVMFDDERYVNYDNKMLDELELAYAITVHKSQGSEFPVVILPVSWFPPMLATRNLLYTAITRGKKAVVIVGPRNRMDAMVDNDRIRLRYSGLGERLGKLAEYTGAV